ncbi:MAG: B12-binding domain-containing radical SAM protein, partial [Thermoplasmata archaeon]|nr:B12-binding domain-containing radical SAM protein [Thermoplasmata archaeon]
LYPSLGVLTLAAYLRDQRHTVEIVDLTFARDLRPLTARLRKFRPEVVGVHTKTLTFPRASRIAQLATRSGAFSVAGGPDAASRPEGYLDAGFRAVASGEGETALTELAERVHAHEPVSGLAGIVTREHGQLVQGPRRPFLRDLDALPLPAWDLIDMEQYLSTWEAQTGERRAAVLTSRGCPFDCSWCSKPTFGRSFRQQSPARVLAELRALKERYAVDYVRFCDDVFGVQRAWLEELLEGMVREPVGLKFECLARVDLLKPELLGKMREAGLARVYVGVESGSQKMLDLMNRGTKLAQIERTAQSLREAGVRQFWFLMLGYPGETLEDIEATLALFRRFSPEEYSVSIAVPVPGTRFYEAVRDRLTGTAPLTAGNGGTSLLYDAAYPQALYRWEQARFEWEAALQRAKGKLPPEVLDRLGRVVDQFHTHIATPLLLGGRREGARDLPVVPRGERRPPRSLPARPNVSR